MKKVVCLVLATIILCVGFISCSEKKETYKILDDNFGAEEYAIGMRKGDNAFTLELQRVLEEMVTDGKAAEISKTWFGSDVMLKDKTFPSEIGDSIDDKSLEYIKTKGKLVMGLDEHFPPMGFRDVESGDIVGFDIDLAREVAKRLGVELVIQPIDWAAKELELNGSNIDVIWNGMSITDERISTMNLSKPYIANRQIIIVGENSSIKTKADLAGKKVALQEGSSTLDAVNKEPDVVKTFAEIVKFPDNLSAFLDLKSGRVDAFIVDEVVGKYLMSKQDIDDSKNTVK